MIRRRGRPYRALKWASAALLLLSMVMLVESARFLWFSAQNILAVQSASLIWMIVFTDLPQVLLLWMASIPALGAALHALFWRQGEGYRLRTSRLFAISAFLCALMLMAMMGLDGRTSLAIWQRGVILAQGLPLVLCLWLLHRALRGNRPSKKA